MMTTRTRMTIMNEDYDSDDAEGYNNDLLSGDEDEDEDHDDDNDESD